MPRSSRLAWSPIPLQESPAFKDEHRAASVVPDGIDEVACRSHIKRPGGEGAQPGDGGDGTAVGWMNDDQFLGKPWMQLGRHGYLHVRERMLVFGIRVAKGTAPPDEKRRSDTSIHRYCSVHTLCGGSVFSRK